MANEKRRLIDANALIDWMTRPTGFRCNCDDCPDIDCLHCIIEDCIKNAPTVDAVEVVHGHWIETEEGTICSECHEHPFSDGYFAIANYNGDWCPNCGAKMDGERKDNERKAD